MSQEKSFPKPLFTTLILLLTIFSVLIYLLWITYETYKELKSEVNQISIYDGWHKYSNANGKYTLIYPTDWAHIELKSFPTSSYVVFSKASDVGSFQTIFPKAITISTNPSSLSIPTATDSQSVEVKQIKMDGFDATQYLITQLIDEQIPKGSRLKQIHLKKDENMFVITANMEIHESDKIIESIRFD